MPTMKPRPEFVRALRDELLTDLQRFLEAAQDAAKKAIEERLEREAAAAFSEAGAAFEEAAATPGSDLVAVGETAIEAGRPALTEAIQTATQDALLLGMQEQASTLGISFDLENPRAVAYAREHAAEMVTKIDDETRRVIHDLVEQGTREGWSYDELARQITERFAEFAEGKPQQHIDSRAHLVAVTEVGNAYEEGNLIVADQVTAAGLEMEHAWQTVGDGRVSAGCKENEAAGWIPMEQAFPSGHTRPLRFPGCRCTALYRRRKTEP
jgi:uncharacterized protein with gpF-like domain